MAGMVMVSAGAGKNSTAEEQDTAARQQQLSLLEFILSILRKSMVSTCRLDRKDQDVISAVRQMEIGWPTNVQHITHVTFDRFHGFLGLPVEFEVEIPGKAPSASVSVFGVSPESMQCSYDTRGNSVPTILLLMQERLYTQGGLKSEGIFRINPENSQEEHVRDQLNSGIVPQDIDVHCLAGLIKAWLRELPSGVLDGLSPEQVLQCNTEEESIDLIMQLKPTESAILNWAVDLMADVVEQEEYNKMNARNIAMVFAPNMTQMSDPLTALMHAVQVMNLLKTLITKAIREREEEQYSSSHSSGARSDDEDSQHEMEQTSCEYSPCSSRGKEEEESLSEIEDSFLRQINENETPKHGFRKQLEGILLVSPPQPSGGSSTMNVGSSCLSLSESRMEGGSSFVSMSDSEESRNSGVKKVVNRNLDTDMVESV